MTDSQGPVWQVFERPAHRHPVRAAGSVHAVDAETALQNAWAVYGRRPTAVALWVVPRCLVLTRSRQAPAPNRTVSHSDGRRAPASQNEQCGQREGSASLSDNGSAQTYCVFRRSGAKINYEEEASIVATSAEQAMARALAELNGEDCHAVWVFPAAAIVSSETPAGECSFSPQPHKWFRDHKSFPTGALLREIEKAASESGHA
jgi:ring-1,2-phenylacetyl-CoA epoxidase subunit PaaB